MFHIRNAGETFGNACAEFSHQNKHVITTYAGACAHRIILAEGGPEAYSVVTDYSELENAVLKTSTKNEEMSPYAIYTPKRVTQRLLELSNIAILTHRASLKQSGGVLIQLADLRNGQILHCEEAGLTVNADLSIDPLLTEHEKMNLLSEYPVHLWELCLSASYASSSSSQASQVKTTKEDKLSTGYCFSLGSETTSRLPLLDVHALIAKLLMTEKKDNIGDYVAVELSAHVLVRRTTGAVQGGPGVYNKYLWAHQGEEIEVLAATSVFVLVPVPSI